MKKFDWIIQFISCRPTYQKVIILICIGFLIFFSSCALNSTIPIDNVTVKGVINVR